jgi:hypothetical protein
VRTPDLPLLDDAFSRLQSAASHAATSPLNDRRDPTPKQAVAGNYKKAPYRWNALLLMMENVRNSVRSGTSPDGKVWANRLQAHYGEVAGTVGADGDPVDVFMGLWPESAHVWIINQGFPSGGFDEHKLMLGFATEQQARDAYAYSFDRDWTGLRSMHPATVPQLKWWLKHGNLSREFTPDQLPFDGTPAMNKTLWTPDAQPASTPLHKLMYDLRTEDGAGLLLDAVTLADIYADPDFKAMPGVLLDALVVEVNKLSRKMDILQTTMNAAGGAITAKEYQISDPVKLRGVVQVAVLFQLSDGQTITVWLHNPDTTPGKLTPLDELISWKWMLNKKDITIVVAPERGRDLNVREVARRIMRLAERNSETFKKANTKLAERVEAEFALDSEIDMLGRKLSSVQTKIEVAKVKKADDFTRAMRTLTERMNDFSKQIDITKPNALPGAKNTLALLEELMNNADDTADEMRALRGEAATGRTSWDQWNRLRAGDKASEWRGDAPMYHAASGTVKSWDGEVIPDFAGIAYNYMARAFVLVGTPDGDESNTYLAATTYAAAQAEAAEYMAKLSADAILPDAGPAAPADEPAPAVEHAVAALEIARDVAATNEPINREEGNTEQANLEAETVASIDRALEVLRSGTPEEGAAADAALAMAAGVVADMGGTFAADGHSGEGVAGAWSYGNATVNEQAVRLAASGGGVVQVNGHPFGPDGEMLLTAEQVRAAIEAAAPAPEPAATGDISYRADDMFTTFLPDTAAGEEAWRVINATEGSEGGKVFNQHAESVIAQLRSAGYTVTEAAPVEMTAAEEDALAAALSEPAASEEPAASGPTFAVGDFLTAKFAKLNKQSSLADYHESVEKHGFHSDLVKVEKVLHLSVEAYDDLSDNLMADQSSIGEGGSATDVEGLPESHGSWTDEQRALWDRTSYRLGTVVSAPDRETYVIDAQGYNYARYAGIDLNPAANPVPTAAPVEAGADTRAVKRKDDSGFQVWDVQTDAGVRTLQRLNSTESMGLPGWHDVTDPTSKLSYIADTKDEAVTEIIKRYAKEPEAAPAATTQPETESEVINPEVLAARAAEQAEAERNHPQWVEDVTNIVAEELGVDHGDADAVMQAQAAIMQGQWAAGASAADAAAAVLAASEVPDPLTPENTPAVPTPEAVTSAPAAEESAPVPPLPEEPAAETAAGPAEVAPDASGPSLDARVAAALGDGAPDVREDRAYLESLIDGSGDLLAEDTFARMEPMFAKYEADPEMNALLERAAEVYGEAATAAAKAALATPA